MTHSLEKTDVVGVIGAGAMGAGIAQIAAVGGHPVVLFDSNPHAAVKAISGINTSLLKLVEKGRLTGEVVDNAIKNLRAATDLDEFKDAALIIEAVVEKLDIKQRIFGALEQIVGSSCIFATNTSSISITAIGASLCNPSRLAGFHFFNPAPLMALVEVVSGLATAAAVVETLRATALAWGKLPVSARSTPGFIVNRVARPFYAEALRILNERAAAPATVDKIMRESGGFRMGPFELMDLIGHDVNYAVTESVFRANFFDQRFTPSLIQQELVSAGFLGRKSGRGFYSYGDGNQNDQALVEPSKGPGQCIRIAQSAGLLNPLLERLHQLPGASVLEQSENDDLIAEIDGTVLLLTDGRTATRRARETNHNNVVLVDLALDYGKAKTLALSRSKQCDAMAYDAVVGSLQNCGYEVAPVADVAGLVVMRTVAMLANEAADAVNQGVCSVQDLDTAMEKGVNYPVGPLKWADALGFARVYQFLLNLVSHYGEDRYRISPLLAERYLSDEAFYVQDRDASFGVADLAQ